MRLNISWMSSSLSHSSVFVAVSTLPRPLRGRSDDGLAQEGAHLRLIAQASATAATGKGLGERKAKLLNHWGIQYPPTTIFGPRVW